MHANTSINTREVIQLQNLLGWSVFCVALHVFIDSYVRAAHSSRLVHFVHMQIETVVSVSPRKNLSFEVPTK